MTSSIARTQLTADYSIPKIINGGWQLATGHALAHALDMKDAHNAFAELLDRGFDTFDCADIYTGVEAFYGQIIAERRCAGLSLPQIHTKFVPDLKDLAHVDRAYVERVIERSLSRLGVERLDMVQFHWWDYDVPGMIDTAGELMRLQEKGLIRCISTTNINTAMMVYLAQQASGMHFSGDIVNVPGTSVMGAQKHAEYQVDPDALLEMVLDIFYEPVDG